MSAPLLCPRRLGTPDAKSTDAPPAHLFSTSPFSQLARSGTGISSSIPLPHPFPHTSSPHPPIPPPIAGTAMAPAAAAATSSAPPVLACVPVRLDINTDSHSHRHTHTHRGAVCCVANVPGRSRLFPAAPGLRMFFPSPSAPPSRSRVPLHIFTFHHFCCRCVDNNFLLIFPRRHRLFPLCRSNCGFPGIVQFAANLSPQKKLNLHFRSSNSESTVPGVYLKLVLARGLCSNACAAEHLI